jgi:hypothetical protein
MAPPKDPKFPDPARQEGVPIYPTPLVPDYVTKTGHIILVEVHSTQRGNYQPLPLDGSITYTERDANQWPSPLYLVAERLSQDGHWVTRFWANDRTVASQDVWNYALQYSADNNAAPIYIRTYILPRATYTPLAKLTPDSANASALLIKEEMQELPDSDPLRSRYVQVTRIFETLPGPFLTSVNIDWDGMPVTEQRRRNVLANITEAETLVSTTWTMRTSEPTSDIVGWEVVVSRTVPGNTLLGYEEDPETFEPVVIQKQLVSDAYTPTIAAGYEESVQPISLHRSMRIRRTIGTSVPDRDEGSLVQYDFPCLIFGYTGAFIQDKQGNQFGYIDLIRRSVRRKQTQARIRFEYFTTAPSDVAGTVVNPVDLVYDGIFFSLNEHFCLTDAFTITYTTGSNNPTWDFITESRAISATTPSATTYTGWITAGDEIIIGSETHPWKYNLWRRVTTYVIAQ